ncbi:MAG: hypothetical protein JXA82_11600 [Sedimentisphaerales bacterium]|nr:hypothetical protein [Sedimentisphaerales bacterium]
MPEDPQSIYPVVPGDQVQGLTQVSDRAVGRKKQQEARKRRFRKRKAGTVSERPVEEPQILADEDGHIDFRA